MEYSKEYKELLASIGKIAEKMKGLYEQAYYAYKPQVDDICHRDASQNEVEWLLDWLLQYAGDDRMLGLFYIMEYRKEYDPESLKGTKWEYLLNEDKDFEED